MSEPTTLYCANAAQYQNLRDELKTLALQASQQTPDQAEPVLLAVLKSLAGVGSIDLANVMALDFDRRLAANCAIASCLSEPLAEQEKAALLAWIGSSLGHPKVA